MIKNILVSIGETSYEKNAFEYAGQLSVLLGAHLSCVFFQDSTHGSTVDVAERVLERTKAECALYDFLDCHVEAIAGHPTETICQKARSADLLVVGIPESIKTDGLKLIQAQIDDVLLRLTRPIIIVHEQCTLLRKILVVHHGDASSDPVLGLAAEVGERAKAAVLGLALGRNQAEAAQIRQQMREYLQFYDVNPEVMTGVGFTVANILERADQSDCDLIALSASHHGRLYEMIFQSTTNMVVKLANRAVLVGR